MNITVLLGAPGSGKGTQAKRLVDSGFKHFSTGDMLRAAIAQGSSLGIKAKGFIEKGELVPDDLMILLIEEALKGVPETTNVLLDGFPRTLPQATALDKNPKTKVKLALYFNVPEKALVERLTGRRICEKCGAPFHVSLMPPKKAGVCDNCGGKLIQRKDDSADVVQKRLEVFNSQNSSLLKYYGDKKNLREINADQPADKLQNQLLKILSQ